MKILKSTILAVFMLLLFLPMHVNAQDDGPKVTLKFKNADTAVQ